MSDESALDVLDDADEDDEAVDESRMESVLLLLLFPLPRGDRCALLLLLDVPNNEIDCSLLLLVLVLRYCC